MAHFEDKQTDNSQVVEYGVMSTPSGVAINGSVMCPPGQPCGLAEMAKLRSRVQYPLGGDFYVNSMHFPRPVNLIRKMIRQYRADNFPLEYGNYGTFDLQGMKNRLTGKGNPYPDPVGSMARN